MRCVIGQARHIQKKNPFPSMARQQLLFVATGLSLGLVVTALALLALTSAWRTRAHDAMAASVSKSTAVQLLTRARSEGKDDATTSTSSRQRLLQALAAEHVAPESTLVIPNTPFPLVYVASPDPQGTATALVRHQGFRAIHQGGQDLVPSWDTNAVVRVRATLPPSFTGPLPPWTRAALKALDTLQGPGHYAILKAAA
jgi:hypothetical protein